MTDEAPPIRVWIFPVLAALTLLLSFFYYCYSGNGPYARVVALSNRNLENALIENTRDTAALSIVILGSSLTEYALMDPHSLEDSISRATAKKTKLLRVATNYMDMDIAKRIDFFHYVSKHPPTYLFIENFSFNLDREDSTAGIPEPIDAALLELRNIIRKTIGLQARDNYYAKWYTFDVKPAPDADFYTHAFDSVMFKSLLQGKSFVRSVSQNHVANIAYEQLAKRNTKVVFLDMPLNQMFPPDFLDKQSASELNDLLKFYKTQYHIDYWRYPYVMDNTCYTDGAHLNSKGAVQYQKWFVTEIAAKQ
jgi:hypothetical protein